MSQIVGNVKKELHKRLEESAEKCIESGLLPPAEIPKFSIEIPADSSHGDFAANIALVSAKKFCKPPREIAKAITENLNLEGSYFERVEIAGPGFINIFLNDKYYGDIIKDVLNRDEEYGSSDYGKSEKVLVEFVSANPTGPMHMGNARGGALGDCLASVLTAAGYDVEREFYVNDAGNQIEKFAHSLDVRYHQIFRGADENPMPEDCYQGEDIMDRAKEFAELYGDKYLEIDEKKRRQALVEFALPLNIEKMKTDIAKYRISYDTWFHESSLYKSGEVEQTIEILKDHGLTYEKDGATYYLATKYGSEKDEVLIRSNGNHTYFAADIAYHRNKFNRGFDRCINIWGADHHGHVARMKGAMDAVGLSGEKLDIVLMQLVKLMYNGEPVRMSKRTGKAIQLADLLEEVPVDAARFFFNMREANSQMDFDLGLAVSQDSQNPVYYVQYAHARICSILKALEQCDIHPREVDPDEYALLKAPEERELIRHISSYTDEIIAASRVYDPAKITHYVIELATLFHKFYNACRVKDAQDSLRQARIALCIAAKTVIRNVLNMLKINIPEKM